MLLHRNQAQAGLFLEIRKIDSKKPVPPACNFIEKKTVTDV